jgi:selenocysteine-specific elongation factor
MQVIATAGHVDHGKSTLVRALTGMEPDRWAEERRRGLTIDLGFAWLTLPSGDQVAFVDVPGHERFVPNMLAGVGPVPAVLFAVAADGGWMPQSAEHLAALDALGIRRGVLAVTRADLADPGPARREALARISATSLGMVESVAVSAVTGEGLPELLDALGRLAGSLPVPDPAAPVRLWVDRSFSIKGSGTVVTGTLAAGTLRRGQELLLAPAMQPVRVRGIESLKESADQVSGVARVALNLRGADRETLSRGMALLTAGDWTLTSVLDVRLAARPGAGGPGGSTPRPPRELTVHVGSARTAARVRLLGGLIARLTLRDPLPLHAGDRLLLRDPGDAAGGRPAPDRLASARPGPARPGPEPWPALVGATVLDVIPPPLARRGAAASAAAELAAWPDQPAAADLLGRHGLLRAGALRAMGIADHPAPVTGDWLADPGYWAALRRRLAGEVTRHARDQPLASGLPLEAARASLGVPDRRIVEALAAPPLVIRDGAIGPAATAAGPALPDQVRSAVAALRRDLAAQPFLAPDATRLRELGLDPRAIAAAQRAGLLLRISEQIVLAPGADTEAARLLATLPEPFTAAQAREMLRTTRRVALPLLQYLDRAGITERLADDRRRLSGR